MTIYINYACQDKSFVDQLVIQIDQHVNCCIELWELSEGEPLIEKVKNNTGETDAILIILSKESAASEWCHEKLSSGLLHELDEKRAVIVPVLIEDCAVPGFAQGRQIADFRTDMNVGLRTITESFDKAGIAKPNFDVSGFLDWCSVNGKLVVVFTYLSIDSSFTCLTYIEIRANAIATKVYEENLKKRGLQARTHVFETLNAHLAARHDIKQVISGQSEFNEQITINGPSSGEEYSVVINVRLLGEVAWCQCPVDVASLVEVVYKQMAMALSKPKRPAPPQRGTRVH